MAREEDVAFQKKSYNSADVLRASQRASADTLRASKGADVAIVGMGARVGPWKNVVEVGNRLMGRGEDHPTRPKANHWGLPDAPVGWFIEELEIPIGLFKIPPREVEEAIVQHPQVQEVAVIGVTDDVRGEVPKAFVITAEGASVDQKELRSFCKDLLAGYKFPKVVEFVEDLPRTPTGKVLKRMLK